MPKSRSAGRGLFRKGLLRAPSPGLFFEECKDCPNSLTTHTPLIKGVEAHPLIKEVGLIKHYKTRGFGQPTPLIRGGEPPPS